MQAIALDELKVHQMVKFPCEKGVVMNFRM